MTNLTKVLLKLPNLDMTKEEHDSQRLEIEFRIDSEFWLRMLPILTIKFPYFYFVKRYFSDGGIFGFRWAIIGFNLAEEQLDVIAEDFDYILFHSDLISKPVAKTAPQKIAPQKGSPSPQVFTKKEKDKEEMTFPIPHVTGELNKPQAGKRKGAYYIKEA